MPKKINDITYTINGAVFEVNRVLGAGFLEKVYEKALLVEFHKRGLKAEGQVPITVKYKDEVVGEYFADIVVEGQVIIELKAVEQLQKIHEAQLLNYLKATGYHQTPLCELRGAGRSTQTHTDICPADPR
jgi:GxxExxY protein